MLARSLLPLLCALSGALNFTALRAAEPPQRRSPEVLPEGVRTVRNLAYGQAGGRELALDLYLPPGDGAKPLIVWLHGGAWRAGDRRGPSPALALLADGYAVAHISYRLSQTAKWPAQIEDCKAAVRWLRANAEKYSLDPKRFAAWGSSAGGHLVAMLGTSGGVAALDGTTNGVKASGSVQAVVDWFGPTDFLQMDKAGSTMKHDAPDSPESLLIGSPIQENKDAAAQANPITYLGRGEAPPPFLIMHGTRDPLVPFHQSELLAAALKVAGADVNLRPVPNAGHGFGGEANLAPVREFLARVLARGK